MAPRRLIKWLALVAVCALFLFAVISTSVLRQVATHRLKFGSAAGVVWRKRVGVEPKAVLKARKLLIFHHGKNVKNGRFGTTPYKNVQKSY
jgi:hypothetical protein